MQIITMPRGKTSIALPPPSLTLPAYAYDGRKLEWNSDYTAVMFDATNTEYHSDKFALSSSAAKALVRSERNLLNVQANANKETLARRLGTAVHARVLEPMVFRSTCVVFNGKRTTGEWEIFKIKNAGKLILTPEEMRLVENVSARALATEVFSNGKEVFTLENLVAYGRPEQTLYWFDAEHGITCKARYDLMVGPVTLDLKTTDDAREEAFSKQCDKLGYDIQAAFYLRGRRAFDPNLEAPPFIIIAAELLEFGDVVAHPVCPTDFVSPGEDLVKTAMASFARIQKTGEYRGYPLKQKMLRLPVYRRFPLVELH